MQIELYNSMLEKEGTDGGEEAKRAYIAAREESEHDAEVAAEEKVSSALIEKVRCHFAHVIAIIHHLPIICFISSY
jgi:hypothetical protein